MSMISIIIPVFNVEDFLQPCMESVLTQTLHDIQVILADDGSPDGCGTLCDEYAAADARVSVIHKPNGGLSDARNAGLPCADGKFVFYLDSDDRIEPDTLEHLLGLQKDSGADVVIGSYFYTYPDREIPAETDLKGTAVLSQDQAFEALIANRIQNFAWGKLIRRDIAAGRLFPKGKLFEDTFWLHWVLHDAASVCVTDRPLVHYLQRDSSISYRYSLKRLDTLDGWRARLDYLKEYRPGLYAPYVSAVAHNFLTTAWLVYTRMTSDQQEAFGLLRRFSLEIGLIDYAVGDDKRLIRKLNKSDLAYKQLAARLYIRNRFFRRNQT